MEEIHGEGVRGGLLLEVFELEVRPMEMVLTRVGCGSHKGGWGRTYSRRTRRVWCEQRERTERMLEVAVGARGEHT